MQTQTDISMNVNHFEHPLYEFWADKLRAKILAAYNSTYKKLAVQWLNEALCFVSSSMLADSFVLRNRQPLVAAETLVATASATDKIEI